MENSYNPDDSTAPVATNDQNGVFDDKPTTEIGLSGEIKDNVVASVEENVALLYENSPAESYPLLTDDASMQVVAPEDGEAAVVPEQNLVGGDTVETAHSDFPPPDKSNPDYSNYSEQFLPGQEQEATAENEPVTEIVTNSEEIDAPDVPPTAMDVEKASESVEMVECIDNDTNDNIKMSNESIVKSHLQPESLEAMEQDAEEEIITGDVVNEHNIVHYAVVEQVDGAEPVEIIGHLEGAEIGQTQEQSIVYIEEYEEGGGSVEGTVVQLQHVDGDGNIYLEHVAEAEETAKAEAQKSEEAAKQQQRPKKGRKSGGVPLHVLGRNISYPAEPVINGKSLPKPRLGVKVPYRNLTSQIVTREEIQREVMKRARLKQDQVKKPSGDFLFARRLTKRLAAKLGATSEAETSSEAAKTAKKDGSAPGFENNSDLLAVLEGEDDEMPQLEKEKIQEQAALDKKAMEREIALQQLQELPNLTPKQRPSLKRRTNIDLPMPVLKKMPGSEEAESEETGSMSPNRIEVKTNTVLKTYSRKRKTSEESKEVGVKQEKKSPLKSPEAGELPRGAYVTKSSRVIKKKIIWDPDEAIKKGKLGKIEPENVEKKAVVVEKATKTVVEKAAVEKKSVSPQKATVQPEKKTPKKTPNIIKSKKRLTELERLLMDEGAVNMLYDVKNTDDSPETKKKKSVISLDKAHKELIKRTNEIKNELQQSSGKESSKSLRKKEVQTPSPSPSKSVARKLSKDSHSSVHTPPASPAFNFNQHAEASRIIRRRSSSSFSSDGESEVETKKKSETGKTRKAKKSVSEEVVVPKEEKREEAVKIKTEQVEKAVEVKERKVTRADTKYGQYNTLEVKKNGKLLSVTLTYPEQECFYTIEILNELTTVLNKLNKEKDCYVVLVTSNQKAFSLGIDYTYLIANEEEERKKRATELSTCVKDFLKCLLHFSKILVAGVQGECVGLAVTMLPLFDMVVASDTATFSAPYATLGCMAEAGFLLTVPYITNHGLAAELLYAAQQLKADDAFRRGLVTKLCWPEKYPEELKNLLTSVAGNSKQSLEAMKVQLRHYDVDKTETNIEGETKQWIENWTSVECQKNFRNVKSAGS